MVACNNVLSDQFASRATEKAKKEGLSPEQRATLSDMVCASGFDEKDAVAILEALTEEVSSSKYPVKQDM